MCRTVSTWQVQFLSNMIVSEEFSTSALDYPFPELTKTFNAASPFSAKIIHLCMFLAKGDRWGAISSWAKSFGQFTTLSLMSGILALRRCFSFWVTAGAIPWAWNSFIHYIGYTRIMIMVIMCYWWSRWTSHALHSALSSFFGGRLTLAGINTLTSTRTIRRTRRNWSQDLRTSCLLMLLGEQKSAACFPFETVSGFSNSGAVFIHLVIPWKVAAILSAKHFPNPIMTIRRFLFPFLVRLPTMTILDMQLASETVQTNKLDFDHFLCCSWFLSHGFSLLLMPLSLFP